MIEPQIRYSKKENAGPSLRFRSCSQTCTCDAATAPAAHPMTTAHAYVDQRVAPRATRSSATNVVNMRLKAISKFTTAADTYPSTRGSFGSTSMVTSITDHASSAIAMIRVAATARQVTCASAARTADHSPAGADAFIDI